MSNKNSLFYRLIIFLFFCLVYIIPSLSFAQDTLVCPTPDTGSTKTLQFKSCYLITPTPTNTPTPTMTIANFPVPPPTGEHTRCKGTIVSFGIQKTLIPIRPWHGRPGFCIVPRTIVLHVTATNGTPEDIRDYFASGSNGRGSSTQFIIGRDGRGLQILETLADKVEVGYGVGGYLDDISIEMISPVAYTSKAAAPAAQYATTLQLVKALMKQYNIPLGSLQYSWRAPNNNTVPNLPKGVYGHYQLNPITRTDPGIGWFCDFRNDLGANQKCR